MQAFCIPTEGDNDADAITHDLAPAEQEAPLEWMARMEDSLRHAPNRAKLEEIRAYIGTKPLPAAQRAQLQKVSDETERNFTTETA
jgi:hypothetical protein